MYGFCNFAHIIHARIIEKCGYPGTILELGCGNGGNLGKFYKSRVRVGIDPEKNNIERAELRHNGVKYILGDHTKLWDYEVNEFDVSFTFSVLDHIENFIVALPKMIEISKNVILVEPLIKGVERQARKGETRWWDITWYHDYEKYLKEINVSYIIEPSPMFNTGSGPKYHLIHIY